MYTPCSVGLALKAGVTPEHTHLSVGQDHTRGSLPSRVHIKRGQGRGGGSGGGGTYKVYPLTRRTWQGGKGRPQHGHWCLIGPAATQLPTSGPAPGSGFLSRKGN